MNDNINDPDYDETDSYELNREFHMAVLEPCPNRLIVKILSDMWGFPVSRRIFRRQLIEHHDGPPRRTGTWSDHRSDHAHATRPHSSRAL